MLFPDGTNRLIVKFNRLLIKDLKEAKMLTCPHCKGRCIRHLFNVFMGSFGTATCHLCGQAFGVKTKVKYMVKGLCYCTGLIALLLALTMHSAWPLIVYAAIVLQLFILAMFRFDLVELESSEFDLADRAFRETAVKKHESNSASKID